MIAMGQDKSKELRLKEVEDKAGLVDACTSKMKWTEERINVLQD